VEACCLCGAEGGEEGAAHEFVLEECCCYKYAVSTLAVTEVGTDYVPCAVSNT